MAESQKKSRADFLGFNMKLLIVRHAIAAPQIPPQKDEDRSLTAEGKEIFERFCLSLKHLDLSFDLLLESPLLRARQTADIFCRHFKAKTRSTSQNLRPFSEVSLLLQEIAGHKAASAAVTGHQPFLGELISQSLAGEGACFTPIKRGGMAFLNFPGALEIGAAQLEALLSPSYFSLSY